MTAPMPSLQFYANDIGDFICAIEDRGIHPTEVGVVIRMLRNMVTDNDALRREARDAQTYRANGEAEELADLRDELARAKDRIADLQIRLHDARRKVR